MQIKTAKQLIKEGLVSEQEAQEDPNHWRDTVALIFPNIVEAVKLFRETLLPKIGKETLLSLWHCATGPERDACEMLGEMLDALPEKKGDVEFWLLFREETFKIIILPALPLKMQKEVEEWVKK